MKTNAVVFIFVLYILGVWSKVPKWHRPFERRFNELEKKVHDESMEFRNELLSLLDKVEDMPGETYNASETEVGNTVTPAANVIATTCGKMTEARAEALTAGFSAEKKYVRRTLLKFEELLEKSQNEISSVTENLETRLRKQIEATKLEFDVELIHEKEQSEADILREVANVQKGLQKELNDNKNSVRSELKNEMTEMMDATNTKAASCDRKLQEMKENMTKMQNDMNLMRTELLKDMRQELERKTQRKCGTWRSYEDSCYFVSKKKVTWDEARDNCLEVGAYLAEADNAEEANFLKNIASGDPWLGARDYSEGVWVWRYSGKHIQDTYNGWNPPEPNGGINEDCLQIHWDKHLQREQWNDAPCDNKVTYICEK